MSRYNFIILSPIILLFISLKLVHMVFLDACNHLALSMMSFSTFLSCCIIIPLIYIYHYCQYVFPPIFMISLFIHYCSSDYRKKRSFSLFFRVLLIISIATIAVMEWIIVVDFLSWFMSLLTLYDGRAVYTAE